MPANLSWDCLLFCTLCLCSAHLGQPLLTLGVWLAAGQSLASAGTAGLSCMVVRHPPAGRVSKEREDRCQHHLAYAQRGHMVSSASPFLSQPGPRPAWHRGWGHRPHPRCMQLLGHIMKGVAGCKDTWRSDPMQGPEMPLLTEHSWGVITGSVRKGPRVRKDLCSRPALLLAVIEWKLLNSSDSSSWS